MSELLEESHTLVEINEGRWRANAKCRGTDTNIFFPTRPDKNEGLYIDGKRISYTKRKHRIKSPDNQSNLLSNARMLCVQCPVRKECLSYALKNHIKHGIYGGKTPFDRRGIDPNDPDARIPLDIFLKDLRRIRLIEDRDHTSFIHDVAHVLNISINAAEKLLRPSNRDSAFV